MTAAGQQPAAAGTGFVALDVVLRDGDPGRAWPGAGGTCGNVLSVLSYLGWASYPVARLADDWAAARAATDLARRGVRGDFLFREPGGSTPVVVERLTVGPDGQGSHR